MDSITHLVLGATVGELLAGEKLKKKALLFGAVAASIPDIDVAASLWMDPAADMLVHRGFTHSILFALLLSPILAWLGQRTHKGDPFSFRQWWVFFTMQILLHIFLDAFNAYGTGWFEPFSHIRISFNVLFVADPLFTTCLIISTVAAIRHWNNRPMRLRWARIGIVVSACYLMAAIIVKLIVDNQIEKSLSHQSIATQNYFTTPTPFNSLLWFVVASDENGYHIGYRSIFDRSPEIHFQKFYKQDSLLAPLRTREDIQHLIRFSKGYYTISVRNDTLLFNDLRFGQMGGWSNPNADFVFHYNLRDPADNLLVIQRGRFSNWNSKTLGDFWGRIKGN